MKNILFLIFMQTISGYFEATCQTCPIYTEPYATNIHCNQAISICGAFHVQHDFDLIDTAYCKPPYMIFPKLYYKFLATGKDIGLQVSPYDTSYKFTAKLFGPFECEDDLSNICNNLGIPDTVLPAITKNVSSLGYYILEVSPTCCKGCFEISFRNDSVKCGCSPCEDCLGSFAPTPGKDYILSAWVKKANATISTTNYDNVKIMVGYIGSSTTVNALPSGLIIDGWQRFEQRFTVPSAATSIKLNMICNDGDAYFDDIRIFPAEGSMKSYVYDPLTMRFVAELDERNYASFYEYDEEGKLIRVKKETERGVMTISESRNNTVKK